MRPILKWAGGKAKLATQISDAFNEPCTGTFFEPFLGSGAVFLSLFAAGRVTDAVLADANPKLIEVHQAVRDDPDGLLEELAALPGDDWRERYYDIRELYNVGPCVGPRHAARFIWLNRAGFNGLYRENKSGRFNVPVGRYTRLSIPSEARIREVSAALAGVELVSGDFETIVDRARAGDQVYCDPPYVPLSTTASFTGYCSLPFGLAEQKRLANIAQKAALRGARVVLSNHDLPVVRNELYPTARGFEHVSKPRVVRAISRSARSRGAVTEVIAAIGPLSKVEAA
ncbi:MAG: DNA adenine methylase [Myxococcota bacterium]|jgi:DNA adenine methylase